MNIFVSSDQDLDRIRNKLCQWQQRSRFHIYDLYQTSVRGKLCLYVGRVRLREPKGYCGNHAGACRLPPSAHRPHKKTTYLEGADWVAFNDMLNDALDVLRISANISSSAVIIRKGRCRCVCYVEGDRGNGDWLRDSGMFEDHIGRPHPRALYPHGTPGKANWRQRRKKQPSAVG